MTEEQVTKAILSYLINNGWHIVCFDFPQSGTGRALHPNFCSNEKNKDSIVPDIVAVKKDVCVFFENKDRFYLPDYKKVNDLINNNNYSQAIEKLLAKYVISKIYYGIGIPLIKYTDKSKEFSYLVDFVIGVSENRQTNIVYSVQTIFS